MNEHEEFIKTIEHEYDEMIEERAERDRKDAVVFVAVCILGVCITAAWIAMEYWELWP